MQSPVVVLSHGSQKLAQDRRMCCKNVSVHPECLTRNFEDYQPKKGRGILCAFEDRTTYITTWSLGLLWTWQIESLATNSSCMLQLSLMKPSFFFLLCKQVASLVSNTFTRAWQLFSQLLKASARKYNSCTWAAQIVKPNNDDVNNKKTAACECKHV